MKQAFARLYILLAILLCGGSFAWADEVTFLVGIANNYHMKSNAGVTMNGITVTAADAPAQSNFNNINVWNSSFGGIQKGGSVTVTPSNATITKIVFNCTSTYVQNWSDNVNGIVNIVDDKKSVFTATWTGSTCDAITLTNIGTGQAHITSIIVTYTPARTIDATLNAYGYATFSCEYETKVPNGVVTAYTGDVDEEAKTITWNAIDDGIIPANEGVLLKGTASSTATLTESYTSKTNIEGNKLIANIEEKTKAELGNYIYVLSGSEIVRLSETGKLKANRAYFSMITDIAATGATMRMIWNDAASTIIDVANTTVGSSRCYNLNGQRVNVKGVKRNAKGIVIVNGKKVIQ